MNMHIRNERPEDVPSIEAVTRAAFLHHPHSNQTEHSIINALRRSGSLTLSLVAETAGMIIGHAAVSPVTISDSTLGWYGLGPVSVAPEHQGQGTGSALVRRALADLQRIGACGCVVFGNPGFYHRFGFTREPSLVPAGLPEEYFLTLPFSGLLPAGTVSYHESFDAAAH